MLQCLKTSLLSLQNQEKQRYAQGKRQPGRKMIANAKLYPIFCTNCVHPGTSGWKKTVSTSVGPVGWSGKTPIESHGSAGLILAVKEWSSRSTSPNPRSRANLQTNWHSISGVLSVSATSVKSDSSRKGRLFASRSPKPQIRAQPEIKPTTASHQRLNNLSITYWP